MRDGAGDVLAFSWEGTNGSVWGAHMDCIGRMD